MITMEANTKQEEDMIAMETYPEAVETYSNEEEVEVEEQTKGFAENSVSETDTNSLGTPSPPWKNRGAGSTTKPFGTTISNWNAPNAKLGNAVEPGVSVKPPLDTKPWARPAPPSTTTTTNNNGSFGNSNVISPSQGGGNTINTNRPIISESRQQRQHGAARRISYLRRSSHGQM